MLRKKSLWQIGLTVLILHTWVFSAAAGVGSGEAPGLEFSPLFNGSDKSGWIIEPDRGTWVVEDSALYCKGFPREPYLILTENSYENFDFRAQFKVSPGCNSGIFFHVPFSGRQSKIGFEVQILDDAGREAHRSSTGSIYSVVAPSHNASRAAGEWNDIRVLFDWPNCKVWLNGHLVQNVDFSAHPELKYRLRNGPIGLSNHGHPVWYRNLWIQELPSKERWIDLFNGMDLSGWTVIGDAEWEVKDGVIVASGGTGWLVSERDYDHFHLQVYIENDTLQPRSGAIHYRWKSPDEPGYAAEYYDFTDAASFRIKYSDRFPDTVVPPLTQRWLLYQLLSTDRESIVRVNGIETGKNLLLGVMGPGRIVFCHTAADGLLRLQMMRIKILEMPSL